MNNVMLKAIGNGQSFKYLYKRGIKIKYIPYPTHYESPAPMSIILMAKVLPAQLGKKFTACLWNGMFLCSLCYTIKDEIYIRCARKGRFRKQYQVLQEIVKKDKFVIKYNNFPAFTEPDFSFTSCSPRVDHILCHFTPFPAVLPSFCHVNVDTTLCCIHFSIPDDKFS
jgi:hypothetical protein